MAGDLPLALRRTPRRRQQQHGVGEMPRTPAPVSQRKSSRAAGAARKQPPAATDKAARSSRKNNKKAVKVPGSANAAPADDASDDSVTLVDGADDSITALDFDIPISSNNNNNNNKRKRRSSVSTNTTNTTAIKRARRQKTNGANNNSEDSSVVHILPLRTQILDDHIKRRIRRNGLSAEMNDAYGEKRSRRSRTLAELRRARDELADRDAEIGRLRELTALFGDHTSHSQQDLQHQQDLEAELSRLREEVQGRRRELGHAELTSSPPVARGEDDDGWDVMGDMMSDGGSDAGGDFAPRDFDDEEEFGETSLAELESGGTPAQHRRHHHHQQRPTGGKRPAALHLHRPAALTPPSTSPAKLASSPPARQIHSSTSDAGVQAAGAVSSATDAASQACLPDPAVDALHGELGALRAEVAGLSETLLERDALQARVSEKLQLSSSPSAQAEGQDQDQDVELQLDIVLQDLAEKTDRLGELSSLLLMPPPSSAGDATTPTASKEATAELSTALQSVRDALSGIDPSTTIPQSAAPTHLLAATRLRELDTALKQRDTSHATLTQDLAASRAHAGEQQTRADNLAADVSHLASTIAALRDEVETLQSHSATQQSDLDSARDAALQQKTAAAEAEARLSEALGKVASLSKQLSEREAALRGRDGEVERLRAELASAGLTISRMREGAAREMGRSREAVRAMRAQMVAALRVGEGFLGEGVAKEEEGEGDGVVVMDKAAAPRDRSDDSGLGLDGEGLQLV